MSKAAATHKFRKLRSPTKCRDCDGIVVFQGVECEEVSEGGEGAWAPRRLRSHAPPCLSASLRCGVTS
jgi:hypothetical protein